MRGLPWHATFTSVPFFNIFFLPDQRLYIVNNMHVYTTYTHIWLRRMYMNYRYYQITLRVEHCYKWSGANC